MDLYILKKNKLEEVKRLSWIPYLLFLSLFFLNSFPYSQNLNSFLKTYDTGEKWYEGSFKDGKVDGSYTFWYKNGQKSHEENYKDGLRDGKFTGWYESAKISSENIELYKRIYSEKFKKRKSKNIVKGFGLLGLTAAGGLAFFLATFNLQM